MQVRFLGGFSEGPGHCRAASNFGIQYYYEQRLGMTSCVSMHVLIHGPYSTAGLMKTSAKEECCAGHHCY